VRKNRTVAKILKLKDNRKREIELEVKRAADREEEEKTRLKTLEKDYTDTLEYFSEKHGEGLLDINKLVSYYDFFSRINGKIDEQKKVHSECQDELACLKDSLVHAHQEKRMFEIINDKALKTEHKENLKSEQKEHDFIALSRRVK
jgi:flagellar export protein FliJ